MVRSPPKPGIESLSVLILILTNHLLWLLPLGAQTVYYTLTFALLVAEMGTFVAILLPMPFAARKKIFTFLSTSPIVAKIAYGLKIAFLYVAHNSDVQAPHFPSS